MSNSVTFQQGSLRDYMAAHAPQPSSSEIESQMRIDKYANPHNDHYRKNFDQNWKLLQIFGIFMRMQ